MTRRILVPFDGSDSARVALEYAFELFPDGDVRSNGAVIARFRRPARPPSFHSPRK